MNDLISIIFAALLGALGAPNDTLRQAPIVPPRIAIDTSRPRDISTARPRPPIYASTSRPR